MLALVAAYAIVALLASALSARLGRRVFLVPAALSAAGAAWFAIQAPAVAAGEVLQERLEWMPTLGIALDLRLTPPAWLLAMVVTGVGALIFAYCAWYFRSKTLAPRTVGLLTGFAGSMLGLVLSDDLVLLVVFWELTTVFSYLLVGLNHHVRKTRIAAHSALVVTTIGGLALLVGVLMVGHEAGSLSLAAVLADAPQTTVASIGIALAVVGALAKSAIVPFQFWLPGAMAAPTPVSAFLHAAAMVKAGVFLVAVLTPAFADLPWWRPSLIVLGAATMLLGAARALKQTDAKVLLAHGTVSQLGLLITILGIGTAQAMLAGLAMLAAHAMFKAALFMVVGAVDRTYGTRDLRRLGGVGREHPALAVAAFVAAAAMAGVPPALAFVAKESGLAAAEHASHMDGLDPWVGYVALVALAVGAAMTVAYTLRLTVTVFLGRRRDDATVSGDLAWPMIAFPATLAAAGLALGFAGEAVTRVLEPAFQPALGADDIERLALWHGVTVPLLLTLAALVVGTLVWLSLGRRLREHELVDPFELGFRGLIRGIDRLAVEVTGRTQTGSLPLHVSTILGAVVALPGVVVLATGSFIQPVRLADSPGQLVVVAAVVVAAIFAANTRGRLKTFMLLSVVGYGVALLFLLHGAPDLALTQVLCETVLLVLLVLVLRRQPKYFTNRPLKSGRWLRAALAVGVGAVASLIAVAAAGSRIDTPISDRFYERAYDFGYGSNIVNVTLVDIRAWDTLGEIAVLLVAATGVASLIFIRTRSADPRGTLRGDRGRPDASGGRASAFLRGGNGIDASEAAPVLEMMTRLMFPVMIVVSIYLLLVGHNLPGGGFAGGLVGGLAIALRYLAAGRDELANAAPFDAGRLLGVGIATAAASMLWPVLLGGRIGESYRIDLDLPVLGESYLVTTVVFDVGVYLIVVGAMLDFVRSLGAGIDVQVRQGVAPVPVASSDRARTGESS
ncbi:Na+/H+ antiporter subunit A [Agrococcus jejuensis]|uniref:Multisubunit sodium/proton antiporter, MrpA subunit /multisubunit sodium/proton antiporter, MrpB subunit n=1 Tax=Agrococcus jejuensis TaxID=399736 RepID=A0A1G8G4B7_9MICO|nr:Na+/H+ antiporter subunit A [Agrococcus jejuensis]SDH89161.1 multisubunit sodium/proton antiporter, MrpA subunit /multisubunit sodium/proton antiporter, MrpB subunit [Agrococcus jejuensis]